jgi:uncharacterized membrane protein YqaE (UPF0057 family)
MRRCKHVELLEVLGHGIRDDVDWQLWRRDHIKLSLGNHGSNFHIHRTYKALLFAHLTTNNSIILTSFKVLEHQRNPQSTCLSPLQTSARSCKLWELGAIGLIADELFDSIAIILPPLGVFLERGCGSDLLINILLTILGYIPGIIHAL